MTESRRNRDGGKDRLLGSILRANHSTVEGSRIPPTTSDGRVLGFVVQFNTASDGAVQQCPSPQQSNTAPP